MRASTSSSARSQRLSASRTWLGLGLALGLGLGLGEVAAAQRVAHLGRVDAAARRGPPRRRTLARTPPHGISTSMHSRNRESGSNPTWIGRYGTSLAR